MNSFWMKPYLLQWFLHAITTVLQNCQCYQSQEEVVKSSLGKGFLVLEGEPSRSDLNRVCSLYICKITWNTLLMQFNSICSSADVSKTFFKYFLKNSSKKVHVDSTNLLSAFNFAKGRFGKVFFHVQFGECLN